MSIQSLKTSSLPAIANSGAQKIGEQPIAAEGSPAPAETEKTAKSPLAGRVVKQIAHFSLQAAKLTGQGLYKLGQGIAFVANKFAQLVKSLHDEYKKIDASRAQAQAFKPLQKRQATQIRQESLDKPHASVGKKLKEMTARPATPSSLRANMTPRHLNRAPQEGLNLTGFRNTNPQDLKFIADIEKRRDALRGPNDPEKAAEHKRLANLDDKAWIDQMTERMNKLNKTD
jgi:hypothetical protein